MDPVLGTIADLSIAFGGIGAVAAIGLIVTAAITGDWEFRSQRQIDRRRRINRHKRARAQMDAVWGPKVYPPLEES